MDYTFLKGDSFRITGKTVNGRRFKLETENPYHAFGINLWKGTVFLLRNGEKTILKRVTN